MNKLLTVLSVILFSFTASAQTTTKMLQDNVTEQPDSIYLKDVSDFSSEGVNGYKGRNNNRVKDISSSQVKSTGGVSRSVSIASKKSTSQLENLESTAGELIQKLEDDRLKKTKKHKAKFESNKSNLQSTYDLTKTVVSSNLGSEQDPAIQNAFKCSNLRKCNEDRKLAKRGGDVHDLPQCNSEQRLRWNGSRWECISLFSKPSSVKCGKHQYAKSVNGGVACINYLYYWELGEFGKCQRDGTKVAVAGCYRKKTQKSTNKVKVDDSVCKEILGTKGIPRDKVESCTYEISNWTVGAWSACDLIGRSLVGKQYRDVQCPAGKECANEDKPVTEQSCKPRASWRVGEWGQCDGSNKYRTVTCPRGYICSSYKPASSEKCTVDVVGFTGQWQTGAWGVCKYITDGQIPNNTEGEKERTVTCPAGKLCDPSKKPLSYTSCNLRLDPIDDGKISKDNDLHLDKDWNNGGLGGFDRNHDNNLNLGI